MTRVPTVRVQHPDNPDDFMVINESDYDPEVHEVIHADEPEPDDGGDGSSDGAGEKSEPPALPDGYRIEHANGGYYRLFGPEDQVIEGPSNGKWQGADAAVEAAGAHAGGGSGE